MPTDDADASQSAETLARHKAIAQVLSGERAMTWSDWGMWIYESQCLTAAGRRVAEWAVSVLQGFLGDDFLHQAMNAGTEHALLSPAVMTTLFPVVDGRRTYADLFRLVAQLSLLGGRSKRLQATMANNFDPTSWRHALLQLEVASLALRNGWVSTFEANVGGKKRDVRLVKDTTTLLLELTVMGISDPEQKATEFFDGFLMRILAIEMQHGVQIVGNSGEVAPDNATFGWLQAIDTAAAATARDRQEREVPGPTGGTVRVTTQARMPGATHLDGASVSSDPFARLVGRISGDKARQTAGAGQIWIRLDEHAGLTMFTPLQRMSLTERLAILAPPLREALEPHPHVAGIVLSSGPSWMPGTTPEETCELPGFEGAVALRRLLPVARVRDTVIVARSGAPEGNGAAFMDWYGQEPTWLDWALERLSKPPLDALVHEPQTSTD